MTEALHIPHSGERRAWRHRPVYLGEGLKVTLLHDGQAILGETISITPEGIGVAVCADAVEVCPREGDFVSMSIAFQQKNSGRNLYGLVTQVSEAVFSGKPGLRLDISFFRDHGKRKDPERDFRNIRRFHCPKFMRPAAHCEDPLFFQEVLYFQVVDIGRSGAGLITSARNKNLIEGQSLNLHVYLPLIGLHAIPVEVENIRLLGDDRYRVGVSFVSPSRKALEAIAQYLLTVQRGLSFDELRRQGFPIGRVDRALSFRYASCEAEMLEILDLRVQAAVEEGHYAVALDPKAMIDRFDRYSRHLCYVVGGRVVAAGRVVFNDADPQRSEVGCLGVELPKWLWAKGFVEASQLCTHSSYRGANLLPSLFLQIARIAHQAGYRYLLAICPESQKQAYFDLGFRTLCVVPSKESSKPPDFVVLLEVRNLLAGVAVDFALWHSLVQPLTDYLRRRSTLSFNWLQTIYEKIGKRSKD